MYGIMYVLMCVACVWRSGIVARNVLSGIYA